MDYEKKYKEALERAREWYNNLNSSSIGKSYLYAVFPELAESEDERMRQEIIKVFKTLGDGKIPIDIHYADIFTWLEKQGAQKTSDKPKLEIESGKWYMCVRDLLDDYGNRAFCKGDVYLSEKDGYLIPCNSNVPWELTYCVDTYFRNWDISDAKDGDVLAGSKGEVILMFRGIGNTEWDDVIDYYCYYDCRREDFIVQENVEYWGNIEDNQLKPATKEQRDTLFAKMKDAGYEWDSEKKELKKISQRMISAEAKEAMYDKPTDNDMVEALRTEYEKGRADVIAEMQKELSKEDEAHINGIIDYLLDYKLFVYEEDMNVANGVQKELDWLKSLQRIGG